MLEQAHDYVRRGWGVVPLYGIAEDGACRCKAGRVCPVKNRGKHPNGTRSGTWPDLRSGADIQAWYEDHPDDNVGIITGARSGLFVLDVDGAAGVNSLTQLALERGALPVTRMVRTGSGGLHYYFRHPGHFTVRNSTSWIAPGIDIRGEGGQVVAPPSESGLGAYTVISDSPVAEAPAWLLEVLAEHAAHVEHGRDVAVAAGAPVEAERVPDVINNLRTQIVPDGGRHQHFYSIVAACYEAKFTQGETVTIVAPWCGAVDKFVGRVEQEVARSWGKLLAAKEREASWLAEAGARGNAVAAPAVPLRLVQDGDVPLPPLAPQSAPDELDEAAELEASWAAVDLEPHLDGTYVPPSPALMPRTDEMCLLYPGLAHSLHGESESGKSLVIQAEVSRVLNTGGAAAYVDYESDPDTIIGRLLELGTSPDAIRSSFTYRRPTTDPRGFPHEWGAFKELAEGAWDVIVIDGMTDALVTYNYATNDNDDIAKFMRRLPRYLAERTGAAVVLIDHVAKDADSRGRFALGGQAKMAGLDGAAFTVDVVEPIGRGMRGVIELRVAKDRPGGVRPVCDPEIRHDRTQQAALVVIDSTLEDGLIHVTVGPPEMHDPGHERERKAKERKEKRPTFMMERVSTFLQIENGASRRVVVEGVTGSQSTILKAIAVLKDEGYVKLGENGRGYYLERPYYEHDDLVGTHETGPSDVVGSPGSPRVPTGFPEPDAASGFPGSPPFTGGNPLEPASDPEQIETTGSGSTFETSPCPTCSEIVPTVIITSLGMCGKCDQKRAAET